MLKVLSRFALCLFIGLVSAQVVVTAIGAIFSPNQRAADYIMQGVMGFLWPTATLLSLDRIFLRPRYAAAPLYGAIAAIAGLTLIVLLLRSVLPESVATHLITGILYDGAMTLIGLYAMFNFPPQDDDGLYQSFT